VRPADAIRRPNLGRLQVDGIGDATVLRLEDGAFTVVDADGRSRVSDRRVVAEGCVRAGRYARVTVDRA
jgi:dihydroorotase